MDSEILELRREFGQGGLSLNDGFSASKCPGYIPKNRKGDCYYDCGEVCANIDLMEIYCPLHIKDI